MRFNSIADLPDQHRADALAQMDSGAVDMRRTEAHQALVDAEDESAAAIRFLGWVTVHETAYPQLRWLMHHESGGYRPFTTAVRLQREGQRPGFPDYALYWANGRGFVGWTCELKRADRTNHPTALQAEWLNHLRTQGWQCVVCYGADEAIAALKEYLEASE